MIYRDRELDLQGKLSQMIASEVMAEKKQK
jgi:hypothetical protein